MTSPKFKLFQSIGLALLLVCAAQPVSAQSTAAAAAPQQSSPTSTISNDSADYKLGAGDKIRVIVFGEPDLSNEFVVSSEGMVSLPLIGDQVAAGGTASQLQTRIAAALSNGYLLNPKVNVEVLTFRPFYILGEVNKPGEYPYERRDDSGARRGDGIRLYLQSQ